MDLKDYKQISDILGGFYYINSDGKVWNNKKEKFIKLSKRKHTGKLQYYFHNKGKTTTRSLDCLMAIYFPKEIESIEGEKWKDIIGYEGYYKISNKGRLKSIDRFIIQDGKPRFMSGKLLSNNRNNGRGYINVLLTKGEGYKKDSRYLHILVATHFIDNPENLPEVNHLDFNKSNNDAENLEWSTRKDNIIHYRENKESHYLFDNTYVNKISTLYKSGKSILDISEELNDDYAKIKYTIKSKIKL